MKRLPLSLLVGVVAWPALASAQEDLEGLLDQTVVTAASKSAEVSATAPGTSTVIPAQDLRRFGIHTVAEAVDFLSFGAATSGRDVTGQLGGLGARGVQVAGDEGNHFLLLVNGHSVNEPLAGSARFDRSAGIPLEMVDRIEVILGPGSVLYGSNAMLGVINVVTKRAKDFKGTRLLVESELLTSVRAMTGAGYEFDLFGEPAEITASLEYYQRFGPSFDLDRQNLGIDPISAAPTRTSPDGPATGIWGDGSMTTASSRRPLAFCASSAATSRSPCRRARIAPEFHTVMPTSTIRTAITCCARRGSTSATRSWSPRQWSSPCVAMATPMTARSVWMSPARAPAFT